MQRSKRMFSLLLAAVLLLSCWSAFPMGKAAAYQEASAGNSVTAQTAQAPQDGLIVSFSKAVSDTKIEKIIAAEDADLESVTKLGSLKLAAVSTDADVQELAAALAEQGAVKAVQPNYRYTVTADDPYISGNATAFNQYQFSATRAFEAWDELESGTHAKTRVAVVDTGIDLGHEDLQANVIKQDGKYANFGLGEQKMIDDDMDESDGHGTHVSGIIAATYGNNKGGSGIASGHNNDLVELMTVSASRDGYNLFTIDIVKAIDYAVNHGARVVNMSFGSSARDLLMEGVIQDAYYSKGVVFVAASGNEDDDGYSTPSDIKEVLSVNASNRYDRPTYYSNYGTEKDVLAPGNQIMSTLPGDGYGTMSGTSMASPVAAGIAALVLDANPELTPAQVYNILCASARQTSPDKERFHTSYGYGVLDAAAAVKAAKAAKAQTAVESVFVKSDSITVREQNRYGAEALVLPATCLEAPVWSVADSSIATVDSATGVVTALKAGETTLTVTAGGKSASQKIIVEAIIPLEDITVKGIPEDGVMAPEEMLYVDTRLKPRNATYRDIYVKSSDDSVIAASDNILFAKNLGTATITVESWDGAIKKEFSLAVRKLPTEVAFTKTAKWIFLNESFTFEAKAFDSEGSDKVAKGAINYSTTDRNIFTLDPDTGRVTPVAEGKAYVVATNLETGYYAATQLTIVSSDFQGSDYGLKQTKSTRDSVSVSWKKAPIASGYQIDCRVSGGSWKKVAVVGSSTTSYRQTRLKAGTIYYFRVKALYKKDGATKAFPYSSVIDGRTVPDYRLKQTAKAKNAVTIAWSKVPSASGYQIQYRASKTAAWKTIKTVNAKTLRFKHTRLKAGKTGYYRVRAFYKLSGKVRYFDYSSAIAAKTKK